MNENEIKRLKEQIEAEEKLYDFNDFIWNYIDEDELKENIEDKEELREYLLYLNNDMDITNTDVIYYSNAIEYLKENDPSLQNSLEIAQEFGYDTGDLNSELLASLLKSQTNYEEYNEFVKNICDNFEFDEE